MAGNATTREKILIKEIPNKPDSKWNPDLNREDDIDILDIADGLKELLRRNSITLDTLLTISPSELAEILGIDGYVAKIMCQSAKKSLF